MNGTSDDIIGLLYSVYCYISLQHFYLCNQPKAPFTGEGYCYRRWCERNGQMNGGEYLEVHWRESVTS